MRELEPSEHSYQGEAVGDFARMVDAFRRSASSEVPATSFRHVDYVNHSRDRRLPLYGCTLRDARIRGMFLLQDFRNSTFINVDFAHGAGLAVWTDSSFRACDLRSLRAQIAATRTTFHRCHFGSAYLQHAFFIECRFEKCTMSGVWDGCSLAACHFTEVDLSGSIWRNSGMMDIQGTWKNESESDGFVISA